MDYFVDEVARILASPVPRRQALRLIAGLVGSGVFEAFGLRNAGAQTAATQAAATCKPVCPSTKTCCTTGSKPFCATKPKTCCGNTSCDQKSTCCPGNGSPFCATQGKKCCGSTTCTATQTCCGNRTCCNSNQRCNASTQRCQASQG